MRDWGGQARGQAEGRGVVDAKGFPWNNRHHIAGDLRTSVQKLEDATPTGVLLASGKLAAERDRLDLIDEYKFFVHPRIAGHGRTLSQSGLPSARRLEQSGAALDESASPRRGRHALPVRALTQSSPIAPSSLDDRGSITRCRLRYRIAVGLARWSPPVRSLMMAAHVDCAGGSASKICFTRAR